MRIVPDYAEPAALMVPFAETELLPLFRRVAVEASGDIGVILVTPDPDRAKAFVREQAHPDRFSIVGAAYDTPWIRDRSPIALRDATGEVRWVLPRLPDFGRAADDRLFAAVSAREAKRGALVLAHGNVVAGPAGVALSSATALVDNGLDGTALDGHAAGLGIRRWLVFPPFAREPSGHADVYVRFLCANLAAVAWPEDAADQHVSLAIEALVRTTLPAVEIIRLPLRADEDGYASPLNWVQIGNRVLVPTYDITPPDDRRTVEAALRGHGFRPSFIASPTRHLGGSLHCLTASIFV